MTNHLTHEQLCDLILASPAHPPEDTIEAAGDHLRSCLQCSAELQNLRASLSLFRRAAHSYAEQVYARPSVHKTSIAPSPGYISHVLYWAAAAVIAVAIMLPFGLHRQRASAALQPATAVATTQAQTSESDEALLEGIAQDLSTDVPSAMQPLADPTAGAAPIQSTSDQRKN